MRVNMKNIILILKNSQIPFQNSTLQDCIWEHVKDNSGRVSKIYFYTLMLTWSYCLSPNANQLRGRSSHWHEPGFLETLWSIPTLCVLYFILGSVFWQTVQGNTLESLSTHGSQQLIWPSGFQQCRTVPPDRVKFIGSPSRRYYWHLWGQGYRCP